MNRAALLDPLPLSKFSHHFDVGHRVMVRETGHRGKVTHLGDFNRVHVELDSGHVIYARPHELVPEDLPLGPHERGDVSRPGESFSAVAKAGFDPLPLDAPLAKAVSTSRFRVGHRSRSGRGQNGDLTKVTENGGVEVRFQDGRRSGFYVRDDAEKNLIEV